MMMMISAASLRQLSARAIRCRTIPATTPLGALGRRGYVSPSFRCLMPIKDVEVPTMGDSITEGTIVDLPVSAGTYVDADEVVIVLETDKVSVDVRAPEAGVITEIMGELDDVVEVGKPLFKLDTDGKKSADPNVAAHAAEGPGDEEEEEEPSKAASPPPPAAAPAPKEEAAAPAPKEPKSSPQAVSEDYLSKAMLDRTESRTKMSRMRQRIASRLKEAQNTAAMLTTFQEVDMGNLMEVRARHKDEFTKRHGVKLGFMSAFVKASTKALQEIPAVNAYIDDDTKEIVYRNYCDISVAVASPNGLVVPVLRNTEKMSFADVEKSIGMYGQKAKEGSLALEDMAGGSFTISNGGVFGSLMGTPIINPPQSAILGMHATKMRAVVVDGEIVARPMMYLALTYDHRLIDGREAVTFLKSVSDKIADPSRLLFDL